MATRAVIKRRTPAQWLCLLGGAVLFVRGIVGFFAIDASFDLPGEGWHNLFHLASGVLLFLAASQPAFAKPAAIGYGVISIGLAIAGIVDGEDALGVFPVRTETHVLHSGIGAASLLAGLLSRGAPMAAPEAGRPSPA
jgi:hypothetical protein